MAEMWHVYDGTINSRDESLSFKVRRALSEGPMYIVGLRLTKDDKLYMPSYRAGLHFKPIVILPHNARQTVKRKAIALRNKLKTTTN